MSSSSPASLAPSQVIDIGTTSWCWSQLGLGGEGILSYPGARGRASLAVPYVVVDHQISISLAPFNHTGWLAEGTDTRLEVTGRTPDDQRWVVRATGQAKRGDRSGPAGDAHARRVHPSSGVGYDTAVRSDRLFLQDPRVRGFSETSFPPEAAGGQPQHPPGARPQRGRPLNAEENS